MKAKLMPRSRKPRTISTAFITSAITEMGTSIRPFMIIAAPDTLFTAAWLGTRKKYTTADMSAMTTVIMAISRAFPRNTDFHFPLSIFYPPNT